jgi:hypothetical protein
VVVKQASKQSKPNPFKRKLGSSMEVSIKRLAYDESSSLLERDLSMSAMTAYEKQVRRIDPDRFEIKQKLITVNN